jgi:hypothetical protein
MALLGSEALQGGFVIDKATGMPVFTTVTAGAQMQGGYLRDPDGRLVVRYL